MNSLRRLRALFRKEKLDAEMAEEMRTHLELQAAENVKRGLSADEARSAARRSFGGVEQIKERARDQRGWLWLDQLLQDMRFAVRSLYKTPGFTAVAVLSLALGIGANTALFSLVDDVLLKSLPVRDPDSLVLFRWLSPNNGLMRSTNGYVIKDPATGLRTSTSLSNFIFDRLRADPGQHAVFGDFFAFASVGRLTLDIDHQAELANGQVVSGGYFAGLGVSPHRGRALGADDDQEDAPPAAMISHRFWQRRFAADPAVIGKTIRANNVAVTIVGITPENFHGTLQLGDVPDMTFPLALEPRLNPAFTARHEPLSWWLHLAGRLKPGVTAAQAQARLEPIFVQAARDAWIGQQGAQKLDRLETRADPLLRLVPGAQGLVENRRTYDQPLLILQCIVGAVLLIACTNVANLLLARAATRAKEIAVRLSIGASRWRLVRQLLTESVVLSLLGGVVGVVFAFLGRDALLALRPIGGTDSLALDWRVLGFTLGVSLLIGLVFGLAPAWRATRVDLNSVMKGTSATVRGSRLPLRSVLMVAQVALSVVLLVGAGLFMRTLHNLRQVDPGFNRENLLLFSLDPGLNGYARAQSAALFERVLERVSHLPGVRSAGFSRFPFLSGGRRSSNISVPGRTLPPGVGREVNINFVHPAFFQTMEIPLVLGRNFIASDVENSPRVVVVSQKFADKIFPGENPLGQRFAFGGDPTSRPLEIVGVVRDAHYADLRSELPLIAYTSFAQEPSTQVTFAVRTAGNPRALGAAIRQTLHDIDPEVPLFNLRAQEEQDTQLVASERLFALLTAFFGGVALLLTCIGLYGLLAHTVATRTREIGIRMALGAQVRAVISLVLGEGLRLVALGVGLGFGVALGVMRFVSKLLYGVSPVDPLSLGGAALLLIAVAAVACWLPARRAAKVDPMVALRAE